MRKTLKPFPSTSPEVKNHMSDPNVQNMRSRKFHDRNNGNVENNLNNNSNNRFHIKAEDDQLANYQKVPAGKIGSELRISKELLRHVGQLARHCADAHEYNMKTTRSFANLMRYFDELANETDREETSSNEARDTTKELKSPDSIQSEVPLIMRPCNDSGVKRHNIRSCLISMFKTCVHASFMTATMAMSKIIRIII